MKHKQTSMPARFLKGTLIFKQGIFVLFLLLGVGGWGSPAKAGPIITSFEVAPGPFTDWSTSLSVIAGEQMRLKWNSVNAVSCDITSTYHGNFPVVQAQNTGPEISALQNDIFRITCKNGANQVSLAKTVNVSVSAGGGGGGGTPPPVGAPTATITANGTSGTSTSPSPVVELSPGQVANMSWWSTNAASCETGGSGGTKAGTWPYGTGSIAAGFGFYYSGTFGPPDVFQQGIGLYAFTVRCKSATGQWSPIMEVRLKLLAAGAGGGGGTPPPAGTPLPTASLTLNGAQNSVIVPPNSPATVGWSSANATSCTATSPDPLFSGLIDTSGSQEVISGTTDRTYSVTCKNATNQVSSPASQTLIVSNTAPLITFYATNEFVPQGGTSTLIWTVTNATECQATNTSNDTAFLGAVSATGGNKTVSLIQTTNYTLTCKSSTNTISSKIIAVSIILASCGNGTVDPGEGCDLGSGYDGNGTCPSLCSQGCTVNTCTGGGLPNNTCAQAGASCREDCFANENQVGTCNSGQDDCCALANPPTNVQPNDFTNPLAFNTVEQVLDQLLNSLQAIIAILAIIAIVIGGIMYITSSGDEGRISTAKKIITVALAGFAIGVATPSFLKQIGEILGWGSVNVGAAQNAKTLAQIATSTLNFLLSVVGVIGIIMLVVGGLMYLTSAGDEDRIETGKKMVKYSIIGVLLSLASLVLVTQIAQFFAPGP